MDENIATSDMMRPQRRQPGMRSLRQAPGRAWAIGVQPPAAQGHIPAIGQPIGTGRALATQGRQRGVLVIAHEVDHGQIRHAHQRADHARAVRPSVNIIAQMDDQRPGNGIGRQIRPDRPMQLQQLVQAAMDIAHRIDALSRRQAHRA